MPPRIFTTEVWTARGLITFYTLFVIELHSRRVHIVGSTPHPDDRFMVQIARTPTDAVDRLFDSQRFLINPYAERFVRSINEECLDRIIPRGEWHFRRTLEEFVVHSHGERNHQGLGNELIDNGAYRHCRGSVRRRQRLGGLLSHYYRARRGERSEMSDRVSGHYGLLQLFRRKA